MVSILVGMYGSHRLQMAEDVVQEALIRAMKTWPLHGTPDEPAAWLLRTAKNLAVDQLRREQTFHRKQPEILAGMEDVEEGPGDGGDDLLRLLFVCCHPALPGEAQTALALKTLCGFSAGEIAKAFLISEVAVMKRLTRARQKIRELALPFAMPEESEISERLDPVFRVIYLLFNEGYKASSGERLVREEFCAEAIRLAGIILEEPLTRTPRGFALLALMQLCAARLPARTDDAGNLLRLHEQDRGVWDRELIAAGMRNLARSGAGSSVSEYHVEAAIAACHCAAVEDAATDWVRILGLYDRLVEMNDSPVVALNRAVAVARVSGPLAGLEAIEAISGSQRLEGYHLYHVIRGVLLGELGRNDEGVVHFRQALELTEVPAEREFIARRMRELGGC
jgi:RNA polymerase sigma-70 factor (ECF subfamily)